MKKYFLILTIGLGLLISCKKDKNESDATFDLLTAKPWKYSKQDKNTSTNPAGANIYYAPEDCDMDDVYTFSTTLIASIDRGTLKCDNNEVRTENAAYTFDAAAKTITIDGESFNLAEVSEHQLKYYAPIPLGTSSANLIIIFEH